MSFALPDTRRGRPLPGEELAGLVWALCAGHRLGFRQPIGGGVVGEKSLRVATTQFPVSDCVESNAVRIRRLIVDAAESGADVVVFPEGALSGYRRRRTCASNRDFDWVRLREETQSILELARKHRIWVVLGSCHYLSPSEQPTNCLYIVSSTGRIVDRYDKLMLFKSELDLHSAGSRLVSVRIKGVRCGFMICYDSCFPRLYETYRKRVVEVLFHALHHADNPGASGLDEILASQFRVRALDYGMWIVISNSSARHCRLPSGFAKPDGTLVTMRRHRPGLLCHDAPGLIVAGWRYDNRVAANGHDGTLHIGMTSSHPRALDPRAMP